MTHVTCSMRTSCIYYLSNRDLFPSVESSVTGIYLSSGVIYRILSDDTLSSYTTLKKRHFLVAHRLTRRRGGLRRPARERRDTTQSFSIIYKSLKGGDCEWGLNYLLLSLQKDKTLYTRGTRDVIDRSSRVFCTRSMFMIYIHAARRVYLWMRAK